MFNNLKIDIDMVYTYVNGNDKRYIEKINFYMKNNKNDINNDVYKRRYSNVNEINYSIKSVIKHLPFIRKIFIVTDNQIPDIDKTLYDLKPIIIIDHKDIIDKEYLPTFFSDVIESYIHNIPDLSEIFLYNNDDCFHFSDIFISEIIYNNSIKNINSTRDSFVFNNFSKFIKNEYIDRIVNTKNILKKKYNNKIYFIKNHCTKVFRKSTLKYIENEYPQLLQDLRINKFRNNLSINYLIFAMNIDNILNNNIIINIDNNENDIYFFKCNRYQENTDKLSELLQYLKPKFCCLNDIPESYKDKFIECMSLLL